jgi:hypothetical protein
MMLRKQILSAAPVASRGSVDGKDIPSIATVLVTSEDADHPIDLVFDGNRGRGASHWIAGQPGEQMLVLAFDEPQTIRKVVIEVEEPTVSRTQEIALSVSDDKGQTYRDVLRQEYIFSPPGTTFEHEEWTLNVDAATHLRLSIKPDKGGKAGRATLTTVAIA